MAKDPAVLWYSKDWLEGTGDFMPEEKGVYMDLLMHQQQKGSLPNETKRLSRLAALSESEFLEIWENISHKFVETEDGRLINSRLAKEMGLRSVKAKKRAISGIFAVLIRESTLPEEDKDLIKKKFKSDFFIEEKREDLDQIITKWFNQMVSSLDNHSGSGSGSATVNIKTNKGVEISELIFSKFGITDMMPVDVAYVT